MHMKNLFFATLWIAVAVVAFVLGQPLITGAIGLGATIEGYAQWRLRRTTKSVSTGESSISRAFAASQDGQKAIVTTG